MTEYLLLFRTASANNGYITTTQNVIEDLPKWEAWIGNIAMQGRLVHTAPISYEASILSDNGIKSGPHKEIDSVLVAGFLICKANSLEEAEALTQKCPILKYPNSSVEIRPLIPFSAS